MRRFWQKDSTCVRFQFGEQKCFLSQGRFLGPSTFSHCLGATIQHNTLLMLKFRFCTKKPCRWWCYATLFDSEISIVLALMEIQVTQAKNTDHLKEIMLFAKKSSYHADHHSQAYLADLSRIFHSCFKRRPFLFQNSFIFLFQKEIFHHSLILCLNHFPLVPSSIETFDCSNSIARPTSERQQVELQRCQLHKCETLSPLFASF